MSGIRKNTSAGANAALGSRSEYHDASSNVKLSGGPGINGP
jgi:hypothetical protein